MLQFRKKISAFLLIVCTLILMFPGNSLAVEQCNITEHNNVTVVDEKHIENKHIFRLKINPDKDSLISSVFYINVSMT